MIDRTEAADTRNTDIQYGNTNEQLIKIHRHRFRECEAPLYYYNMRHTQLLLLSTLNTWNFGSDRPASILCAVARIAMNRHRYSETGSGGSMFNFGLSL